MMSKEIEICTIDGVKWILGENAPERMNWQDAMDWCESIGQQLPPREVLLSAYMNPEIRGGFANNSYWSSSEYDSYSAWYQNSYTGYQYSYYKYNTLPVRAVRAIKVEGLTPREGLAEYKKGYAQAELDLKREPLSYEQLEDLVDEHRGYPMTFGRAIEKAHGITGELE